MLQPLRKKESNIRQITYSNQENFPAKVTHNIDFTDEPVIQYGISVEEDAFVDDCKSMMKMRNNRYKYFKTKFDKNT